MKATLTINNHGEAKLTLPVPNDLNLPAQSAITFDVNEADASRIWQQIKDSSRNETLLPRTTR